MKLNNLYDYYVNKTVEYNSNTFAGSLTYLEVFKLVKSRSVFLKELGLNKGDVVGLLALNSIEWLVSYMAITASGYIALPMDTNLEVEDYKNMLQNVGARTLLISNDFSVKIEGVDNYNIDINEHMGNPDKFEETNISECDISTFLFTSGTTGKPKVVQLTHGNMFKASIGGNSFVKIQPASVVLCMLPFYHIFGLHSTFLATFDAGCEYVFQQTITGPEILKSLKENDINIFPAVPKVWEMMIDGIINKVKSTSTLKYKIFMFNLKHAWILRKLGLGFIPNLIFKPVHKVMGESIDYLVTGGAALKREYYDYYYNMGFKIMEGYGLTETTSAVCASDRNRYRPGQSGTPLPGNEVKLKEINDKGIGQLWFRGDNIFPGYYQNEEATKQVFDEEGWFNTGDLGFINKRGEIHIRGREKNLIVLDSGKNVYPEELEAHYLSSDLIEEVAIFGLEQGGKEIVYGVIVPKDLTTDYSTLKGEILKLDRGLPTYKKLHSFSVSYTPLPKTSKRTNINSEIITNLKQGLYTQDDAASKTTLPLIEYDEQTKQIINILKEELKTKSLYQNQELMDFGIDSLGVMNLIVQLEIKLSIKINEAQFTQTNNLLEMVQYLSTCEKSEGRTTFDELISGKIETKVISFFNPLFELLLVIFRFVSKLFWRLKVYKRENLDIKNSIIAINHQSLLDILVILSSLSYKSRKNLYITGKKELKFLKYIFPGISYIFVDRKNNAIPALKAGADVLRQGKSLLIFPEGTRTKDGKLNEFKTGAAFLAKELKKKIVPVTINGAYSIMPTKRVLPKLFSKESLSLTVGNHLDPEEFNSKENLNEALYKSIGKELKV